jgi:hypothetical protein
MGTGVSTRQFSSLRSLMALALQCSFTLLVHCFGGTAERTSALLPLEVPDCAQLSSCSTQARVYWIVREARGGLAQAASHFDALLPSPDTATVTDRPSFCCRESNLPLSAYPKNLAKLNEKIRSRLFRTARVC